MENTKKARPVPFEDGWLFKVQRRVLHHCTHPEEYWARWVGRNFGRHAIPNIFWAEDILADAGLFTPDGRPVADWIREGALPIGIWGSPLDEHNLPIEQQEQGECAATQMARLIGVDGDEHLRNQLAYVAVNDAQGRAMPLELASLIKYLHAYEATSRRSPIQRFKAVGTFADICFDVDLASRRGELHEVPHADTTLWSNPGALVAYWLLDKFGNRNPEQAKKVLIDSFINDAGEVRCVGPALDGETVFERAVYQLDLFDMGLQAHSRVRAFASRFSGTGQYKPFGLASLVQKYDSYLFTKRPSLAKQERWNAVYEFACQALEALSYIDTMYDRALEEVEGFTRRRSRAFTRERVTGRDGKERLLVGVVSDNPQIVRALRERLKPAVIVLKKSNGQTTVFGPKHGPMGVIERELQKRELVIDPSAKAEFRPRWYRFRRSSAHTIMNGGLSAPGVPRTRIEMYEILGFARAAFSEYGGAPKKLSSKKQQQRVASSQVTATQVEATA